MLLPISQQSLPHHSDQILEQLNVQRYYAAFCDITVRVEDVDFKLHKCVLAASCAKLQGMLFNMRPECSNVLTMKDLSVNGFRCVVDYIYTGMLKLDAAYVHDILAASQFFEIREIEKYCLDFFKNSQTETRLPPLRTALQGILGMGGTPGAAPGMIHHHPGMLGSSHPGLMQAPFPGQAFVPMPLPHPPTQPTLPLPHQLQSQPPTAGFDSNYIEDYLKLIETLQGDANQLVAASMQSFPQNVAVVPPSTNVVPKKSSVKPESSGASDRADSDYAELASPAATVVKPVTVVPSHAGPIGGADEHGSTDEARITDVNVVSYNKCIPSTTQDKDDSSESSESVSLTSLLNVASKERQNDSVAEVTGRGAAMCRDKVAGDLKEESSCSDNDNLVVNEDGSLCSDRQEDDPVNCSSDENCGDAAIGEEMVERKESPICGVSKKQLKQQKRKKKVPVKLEQKTQASESEDEPHVQSTASYKHFKMTTNQCVKPLKKRMMNMKRKMNCDKCGRGFGKKELLDKHMSLHINNVMYPCHVCGHKYARPGELTRHVRIHTIDSYKCLHCALEIRGPTLFKRHMELMHSESKAFCCMYPGCEFKSDKPSNVEKHAVIHSELKEYGCPECGRLFAQPNGLQSHLRSCRQLRRYLCDICGAKFNHLQSMKSHRMLHTGEKPFQCIDCNAKFTDHRNFKRHRRIHENLYPYVCTQCDKRFRHSNSLKAHTSTHDSKLETNNSKLLTPPLMVQTHDTKLLTPQLMGQQFQSL